MTTENTVEPFGECRVTALYDGMEQIGVHVDLADRRVRVSDHLLRLAEAGDLPFCEYDNGCFVIHADNGDFRYRVVGSLGEQTSEAVLS